MTRPLATAALLVLPAVASAQVGTRLPSGSAVRVGPPVLGGRLVVGPPVSSGGSALFPVQIPVPPRFSVGGGALGGYPQVWFPSGAWGGVGYPWPVYPVSVEPAPAPAAPARSGATVPPLARSGQANATLLIQFPAAADVRVSGKKVDGDPAAEWTLTAPAPAAGEAHTFEVTGRWKAGGKTFEATRSVAVTAGDRTRLVVIIGTEVKE